MPNNRLSSRMFYNNDEDVALEQQLATEQGVANEQESNEDNVRIASDVLGGNQAFDSNGALALQQTAGNAATTDFVNQGQQTMTYESKPELQYSQVTRGSEGGGLGNLRNMLGGLPGKARSAMTGLPGKARSAVAGLPGMAGRAVTRFRDFGRGVRGLFGKAARHLKWGAAKLRGRAPTALAPNHHPNENIRGADEALGRTGRDVTYWAKNERERAQFRTQADDGKLSRGGQLLDTSGSEKSNLMGSKQGRNMVVMGPDGRIFTADQQAEMAKRPDERVHHTTMLGGEDVAGAGEIEARKGQVEWLTDKSGHYRPEFSLTHQLFSGLENQGTDMSKATVELSPKPGAFASGLGNKRVWMNPNEISAYGPEVEEARMNFTKSGNREDLSAPEQEVRERHEQKNQMMNQLLGWRSFSDQENDKPETETWRRNRGNEILADARQKRFARQGSSQTPTQSQGPSQTPSGEDIWYADQGPPAPQQQMPESNEEQDLYM